VTGRKLYDKYVDAEAWAGKVWDSSRNTWTWPTRPLAWPFLTSRERKVWNDLAKRITPRPKKKVT
jgi:hypothetical protein